MPVPCNLIKPYMLIISCDEHDAILTGALPPAPAPVPARFSDVKWLSTNAVYWPSCSDHSPNVNGDSHPIYKRNHEVKMFRLHVMLPPSPATKREPPVLPPWSPPALTDLGLITKHILTGNSKCRFGPFSVKGNIAARGDSVGVINIPCFPIGLFNSESCGSITLGMALMDVASPNSVVAGMSLGDYAGCIAMILLDKAVTWIKNSLFDIPDWASHLISIPIFDKLSEAAVAAASQFIASAVDVAVARGLDGSLGDLLGPAVAPAPLAMQDASAQVTVAYVDTFVRTTVETSSTQGSAPLAPLPPGLQSQPVHDRSRGLKDRVQRHVHDFFGVPADGF